MHKYWILIGCVGGLLLMLLALRAEGEDESEQPAETSVRTDAPANVSLMNWPSFRGPNALGQAAHAE